MKVLLYKTPGLVTAAIRWQTRGTVDHAALEFGGREIIEATWPRVRRRFSRLLPRDRRSVEVYEVDATRDQANAVRDFCLRQVGKRYDLSSVFRFVSRKQASRKAAEVWFCSELVYAGLREGGIDLFQRTEPWEVSPEMLRRSPLLTRCQ